MSLVTWNGHLLLSPGGSLVSGPASATCCCEGGPGCCDHLPATMYLDIECPDTSEIVTIELTASDPCTMCEGTEKLTRFWQGSGSLSCSGTLTVYVGCDGTLIGIHLDDNGSPGPPSDVCDLGTYNLVAGGDAFGSPWSATNAPPGGCEECGTFINWTVRTA